MPPAADVPAIVQDIYLRVKDLERLFPGRHFTLDGHVVGSIGECLAAHYFGLTLLPASSRAHDATCGDKQVQIKTTQRDSVGLRCAPKHLLVLRLRPNGVFDEMFNGPGRLVWKLVRHRPRPSNGQYQVRLTTLKRIMLRVPIADRLPPVLPLPGKAALMPDGAD